MAKYWLDTETGEQIKLTHNLKAVYHHRLEQYRGFTKAGCIYFESHQTVADKLALDVDTVKKVIHPLLVRMGLIHVVSQSTRDHKVYVYELKFIKGKLINDKLSKHHNKGVKEYKDKTKLTFDDMKVMDKNRDNIKNIQHNLKEPIVVMKKADFDRLMKSRRD
jgi:hypothetical protein